MKSWKRQLNRELDRIVPELRDDVRNAPVPSVPKSDEEKTSRRAALSPRAKRTIFASLATAAAAFLLVFAVIGILPAAQPPLASACVTVEINPEANFVTDKDGNVTHVTALNEDADLMFTDEAFFRSLTGKPLDEAVSLFVDRAAQLGFLDLNEKGGAVRLTASETQSRKSLDALSRSLADYFCGQGAYAVVATEYVPDAQFRLSLGISEDGSLNAQAEELSSSYTQRTALSMPEDQLSSYYRENYLLKELRSFLQSLIREHFRTLRECGRLIGEMSDLNAQIKAHPDNPNLIFKDYWNVRLFADESAFTPEFGALMDEMSSLAEEYGQLSLIPLTSESELELKASYYDILPIDELEKLANDFTEADFDRFADDVLDLLDSIGLDTAFLRGLMKIPATVTEFLDQTFSFLRECAQRRLNDFREAYEAMREKITAADYEAYIDGLLTEYGSLNAYWETLGK